MRKTLVLVILDGWGIGQLDESNPIHMAAPETIHYIERNFPAGALQASGIAVGLPWEEEGNSEVGHLTIGAGKTLYQHFPKISLSIDDGTFFKNPALLKAFEHAKQNNSAVHLAGLLSLGNVHASIVHLTALVRMAKEQNIPNLYLQLFSDGKDSPLRSMIELSKKISSEMERSGVGKIASLTGRYYAMERDNHWDRTEKAYKVLTDAMDVPKKLEEAVKAAYDRDLSDEFISPTVIDEPHPIKENDSVIFFNFREDSMRQITETFLNKNFDKFPVKQFNNVLITTMTEYEEEFPASVAYPREIVENPLGKVLSENKKTQLRIAETEKYAHVTYFFNSLREEAFPNEYRILIPSKNVLRKDDKPEMMALAITDRVLVAINEGGFDFILVNYANPDIIAHTGNFEATFKAVKTIDIEMARLLKSVLGGGHTMIITSDHGNAEALVNLQTGERETKHDPSPVPIYLVSRDFKKNEPLGNGVVHLPIIGLLADVAPTVLALMHIPKPVDMTGQNLLDQLL